MTRRGLKAMIQDEQTARTLVHQLMTVGRDVRSTPMAWNYERKKLDCAVKHMLYHQPKQLYRHCMVVVMTVAAVLLKAPECTAAARAPRLAACSQARRTAVTRTWAGAEAA